MLRAFLRSEKNYFCVCFSSVGVGAYEVRGEEQGIFMKYLQNHLFTEKPIVNALHAVLQGESTYDSHL